MSVALNINELTVNYPIMVSFRKNNGQPDTGINVRANIYNSNTGALIFSNVQFTEILPGIYRYVAPFNFTVSTDVFVEVGIGGGGTALTLVDTMYIRFTNFRQFLTDKTDENDGRAV